LADVLRAESGNFATPRMMGRQTLASVRTDMSHPLKRVRASSASEEGMSVMNNDHAPYNNKDRG